MKINLNLIDLVLVVGQKRLSLQKFFIPTLGIVVVGVLLFMAKQKIWYQHLVIDYGFYAWVVNRFWDMHTFGHISNNAYLPGSLFFFLLPGLSLLVSKNNWPLFVNIFIAANIFLIFLHFFVYRLFGKNSNLYFILMLLFSGPILLFRHELFPSLLVLVSLYFWKKNRYFKSSFMLGLAFATKLYPILIFPYYAIMSFKNSSVFGDKLKNVGLLSLAFFLGAMVFFAPFFIQGSPPSEVIRSFVFNSAKPVHIESLWANLLTLKKWTPGLADQNGIYGLNMKYIDIPLSFFNVFWIFPLLVFYFYILVKTKYFKIEVPFLLILLFIIFSKVITPQYLFWALLVLPLFPVSLSVMIVASVILLLTQYVYPLHYGDLMFGFYTNQSHSSVFYLLVLRNLLLVVLFVLVFKSLNFNEKDKNI